MIAAEPSAQLLAAPPEEPDQDADDQKQRQQVFGHDQERSRARVGPRHLDLVVEEKGAESGVVEGGGDLRGVSLPAAELPADGARRR